MLWYKAWLETRGRFLIFLVGLLMICSFLVLHGERQAEPWLGINYYNYVLSSNQSLLALLWIVAVIILMMGGLLRERAVGAASFTLALPVSRQRLMSVRIGMGLAQACALAIIPSSAMYLIARVMGKAYSLDQFAEHILLLLAGGSIFFSIAILVSSLIEGEYTAPALALGIALVIDTGLGTKLTPYDPLQLMYGAAYMNRHTNLLTGPIPWLTCAIFIAVAAFLLLIAAYAVDRRDF